MPGQGRVHAVQHERVLDCVAGVYATQAQAHDAARQLQHVQALPPAQSVVLQPAHAPWLAFRRQAQAWSGGRHAERRSWRHDALLMAVLGGLGAGLAGTVWWLLDDALRTAQSPLVLLLPLWAGALFGWAAAALSPHPPQYLHFNRAVQRELAAGHWVVLAHKVPWPQQAAAVALLREHSVGWCAVSASWRAL